VNQVIIHQDDVLAVLRSLPAESIHCCITSPPYWGLRDYGVAGQIGLEPTIEEYVAKMAEVFREVRRVLRADGTLFLNLGDSYYGGGGAHQDYHANPGISKSAERNGVPKSRGERGSGKALTTHNGPNRQYQDGLKAKDLCMIPARVALALQQPYYAGKIKNEKDRVWLAAMIDGEGCMFLHKRKEGQSNGQGYFRKNDSYGAGLEVANVHPSIIERCQQITGLGSICCVERETKTKKRNIPLYRWSLRSNQCREIIREIYPYLVGKQHEARLLLGCPPSGPNAEKAHTSLIALHNAKEATIDFPAPASLWEPGWYLRSDVIWSKLNPMPESCTDRPTTAHEHIFLLTKSGKYFYDAEAVKEVVNGTAHVRGAGVNPKAKGWKTPDGWDTSKGDGGHGSFHKDGREDGHYNYQPKPRQNESFSAAVKELVSSRNLRSVWTLATQPYPEAHFATFPTSIPERCIKAGTSEKGCCPKCGAPWVRVVEKKVVQNDPIISDDRKDLHGPTYPRHRQSIPGGQSLVGYDSSTTGWRPTCKCSGPDLEIINSPLGNGSSPDPTLLTGRKGMSRPRKDVEGTRPITRHEQREYAEQLKKSPHLEEMRQDAGMAMDHYLRTDRSGARPIPQDLLEKWLEAGWLCRIEVPECKPPTPIPCTVLDPFGGSGTTALVAAKMGRDAVLIELKPEYAEMAAKRIRKDLGMLCQVEVISAQPSEFSLTTGKKFGSLKAE
jgi:DNA modification methylase